MTTCAALIVETSNAPLTRGTIERRSVGAKDVRLEITYSGICHSDVHQARSEWGADIFPMVPGHEIIGRVIEVGAEVSKFKVGQAVGVGVFVNSCRECDACKNNLESYCERGPVGCYNGHDYNGELQLGGYSSEIVTDEHFVLAIPEALDRAGAAPLLCAGITVYSPLRHWGVAPGKKVAILGMGGLGHLAVKFAVAMGAEVTVLGHSLSKRDDALAYGAVDYRSTADVATFEELHKKFDLILNTTSAQIDVDKILGLLKLDGSLVFVGLPAENLEFNVFNLTGARRSISGSQVGGQIEVQEMLDFAAEHDVVADIELLDAADVANVNRAWDRVVASDVRYRFVIDAGTI